jgi:hypothetical protein
MASKEYMRNWYLKNREKNLEKARVYRLSHSGAKKMVKFRLRGRSFLDVAKDKPCFDCHIKYAPWIMTFDHRDPKQKKFEMAGSTSRSLKTLQAEIDKCDVVCANCHAERTHKLGRIFRPGRPDTTNRYMKRSL